MAATDAAAAVPATGPSTAVPTPRRHIADLFRNQTAIVGGSVIATNLLRVVSTVILTRVLAPEVYGVVGIIGTLAFIFEMVSDLGFQAFVVRHKKGDDAEFLDVIWTIRLLRSIVLCLVLFLLAQPIAMALHKPEIAGLIALSSIFFVIDGLGSLSLLTALRHSQILRLSALELAVAVFQLIVAIILALAWRNAWAMLVATLCGTSVKAVLSYILFKGARRRVRFAREYSSELWHFARYVTGSSVISMVLMQADKVVLARILPLDALGLYILAGNLALAPLAFVSAYASRVLYPLFVRTWHDDPTSLGKRFYSGRRGGSMLYMMGAGGLIGVAPLLVGLLYDARYAGAALYLRLLGATAFFALSSAATNEVLTAFGRIHATFRTSIVKLTWFALMGPIGFVAFGPTGLVAAVGATEAAAASYGWFVLSKIGILSWREEFILLGAGGAGIGIGLLASAILGPALGLPS